MAERSGGSPQVRDESDTALLRRLRRRAEQRLVVVEDAPLVRPARALLFGKTVTLARWPTVRCRAWTLARALGHAEFLGDVCADVGQPDPVLDTYARHLCGGLPGPLHVVESCTGSSKLVESGRSP